MQLTLEQYERIQKYLDGVMTPQDKQEFLVELNENASLKENFDFEKKLRENLASIQDKKNLLEKAGEFNDAITTAKDRESIKSLIKQAGSEWEEENKNASGVTQFIIDHKPRPHKTKLVNLRSWSVIAAAACVVLAIASLVWFMPESSTPPTVANTIDTSSAKKDSNNRVAESIPHDSLKNSNPKMQRVDNITLLKRYYARDTANPPMPDMLAMVVPDYTSGDNSFTGINLDHLPQTRGSSNDINSRQNVLQLGHYYKGLAYIEANDNKQAIENLQWVIDSAENPQLKIKAQWYLGLVYLKENNAKKAAGLFSSLSKNSNAGQYRKQSTEILNLLKQQEQK